jgi:predicted phage terminase large subunit-like protein
MLGTRLPMPDGSVGRACFGTTPKNIPYLKALQKQRGVVVVRGTTYENLSNLAKSFTDTVLSKEGTKIGKQEIHAQDIGDDEDAIFKDRWLRRWPAGKKLPEFSYVLMSMDTAFEEENMDPRGEKDPDYSACSIWGIFNTRQVFTADELKALKVKGKYAAVLCDFWMERYAFPDLLEAARKAYRTKYGSPGRVPDKVLIENKASGISLRQTLVKYGVPTWPFNPRGQSKTMRAHAASPFVMQGCLFVPESRIEERKGKVADWAEPLCDQMTTYTGEGSIEYDDGLDTATQAILHLYELGMFAAEPQGRAFPDPDEKDEQDQREAQRISAREKAATRGNPYGQ